MMTLEQKIKVINMHYLLYITLYDLIIVFKQIHKSIYILRDFNNILFSKNENKIIEIKLSSW